jgi:hypothetical protein
MARISRFLFLLFLTILLVVQAQPALAATPTPTATPDLGGFELQGNYKTYIDGTPEYWGLFQEDIGPTISTEATNSNGNVFINGNMYKDPTDASTWTGTIYYEAYCDANWNSAAPGYAHYVYIRAYSNSVKIEESMQYCGDAEEGGCDLKLAGYLEDTWAQTGNEFEIRCDWNTTPGVKPTTLSVRFTMLEDVIDEECTEYDYDEDAKETYPLTPTSETGNVHTTVPGRYYTLIVEGSWKDKALLPNTRYDYAVSPDSGNTWYRLGDTSQVGFGRKCTKGFNGTLEVTFQAQTTSLRIRVNDIPGYFGDNWGTPSYSLVASNYTSEECSDFSMNDGGFEQASAWASADIEPPVPPPFYVGTFLQYLVSGGYPYCGQRYMQLGGFDTNGPPGIYQTINWPGCPTCYFAYAVRGASGGQDRSIKYSVFLENIYGGTRYYLNRDHELTVPLFGNPLDSWDTYYGSARGIPGGTYRLVFMMDKTDTDDRMHIDQVVVQQQPISGLQCSVPATATPTITPSPTWDGSATPGPSPTPTPGGTPGPNLIANCSFEHGLDRWLTKDNNAKQVFLQNTLTNRFAMYSFENATTYPAIEQSVWWPGGMAFIKYWSAFDLTPSWFIPSGEKEISLNLSKGSYGVGFSHGEFSLRNHITGVIYKYPNTFYSPTYNREVRAGFYDRVSMSSYNYSECDDDESWTPTPTMSRTPTATGSITPSPTAPPRTATASRTPNPSFTPTGTRTPIPTSTMLPTSTYTGPEKTSTAQGTTVPTYTPYPTYTLGPTYTAGPSVTAGASVTPDPASVAPTQQPAMACDAACYRPENALNVPAWLEYGRCEFSASIALCPELVSTVQAMPTKLADKEPFVVMTQMSGSLNDIQTTLVPQYTWDKHLEGANDPVDTRYYNEGLGQDSPYNVGEITFTAHSYSTTCSAELLPLLGARLTPGVCFIFNILHEMALIPWMQLLVNIASLAGMGYYVGKKWIDPSFV